MALNHSHHEGIPTRMDRETRGTGFWDAQNNVQDFAYLLEQRLENYRLLYFTENYRFQTPVLGVNWENSKYVSPFIRNISMLEPLRRCIFRCAMLRLELNGKLSGPYKRHAQLEALKISRRFLQRLQHDWKDLIEWDRLHGPITPKIQRDLDLELEELRHLIYTQQLTLFLERQDAPTAA